MSAREPESARPHRRDAAGTRASARERYVAELAATLRGRLVERRRAEAASGRRAAPDLEQTVRELVEEEAAILAPADRAEIAARVIPPASASGRSRSCSPTRGSRR